MGAEIVKKVVFKELEYCWKCDTSYVRSFGCECDELERKRYVKKVRQIIKEELGE